ncbi:WD repeat-containing protein 73 isoform X1 [Pseudophryne corroboree]|uniref:WD repeat-containing protein 73 isoform X1 n=1 Tax=Pseudophryne corroboree TaxID=495146 RepID=UPI0030812DE4
MVTARSLDVCRFRRENSPLRTRVQTDTAADITHTGGYSCRYKDLHDFELQDPTRVIEWIGEKSICVAGYDDTKTNEVLQLLFPQKLNVKENPGLCPERDLKVEHGGFSEQPVCSLRHVPGTSLLLTSGPASGVVQVWQIGAEDKDVIKHAGSIQSDASTDTWTKIATSAAASPCVVHGSKTNSVHVTEIESTKQIYTLAESSSEAVSTLSFLDPHTFHLCCLSGRQIMADVRQPEISCEGHVALATPSSAHWCAAVKPANQDTHAIIASLSSEGHIILADTRNLVAPLKCARGNASDSVLSQNFMCIRWAPRLEDCLSISGFGSSVRIYDTQDWDTAGKEAEALFTHRGHHFMGGCDDGSAPWVTTHSWHPWKESTLVSAANDGSLHIWDWVDSAAGR